MSHPFGPDMNSEFSWLIYLQDKPAQPNVDASNTGIMPKKLEEVAQDTIDKIN